MTVEGLKVLEFILEFTCRSFKPDLVLLQNYYNFSFAFRGWWRWALVTSPDGVAPIRMVGVSASVNLPLDRKFQKFSSGTGSPGCSRKKGRKTVVCMA